MASARATASSPLRPRLTRPARSRQTVEDCALLLNAMAGFDPHDATSLDRPKEDYTATSTTAAGLRIGPPKEFFGDGAPYIARAVDAAPDVYRKLGATNGEISLPNVMVSGPAYYVVAPPRRRANLSRFDGVATATRRKVRRSARHVQEELRRGLLAPRSSAAS